MSLFLKEWRVWLRFGLGFLGARPLEMLIAPLFLIASTPLLLLRPDTISPEYVEAFRISPLRGFQKAFHLGVEHFSLTNSWKLWLFWAIVGTLVGALQLYRTNISKPWYIYYFALLLISSLGAYHLVLGGRFLDPLGLFLSCIYYLCLFFVVFLLSKKIPATFDKMKQFYYFLKTTEVGQVLPKRKKRGQG